MRMRTQRLHREESAEREGTTEAVRECETPWGNDPLSHKQLKRLHQRATNMPKGGKKGDNKKQEAEKKEAPPANDNKKGGKKGGK
ncbi:hypothetical protein ATCC90586_011932 [Pythium insidiosum]|nr:hypothetical protein ATCC90586_011932 [Pythium insidiosum]